jgi:hypothetical protein
MFKGRTKNLKTNLTGKKLTREERFSKSIPVAYNYFGGVEQFSKAT